MPTSKKKNLITRISKDLKATKKITENQTNSILNIKNKAISIDVKEALNLAMKFPGVKVNREKFLKKELLPHFKKDVVNTAILNNPAQAGIPLKKIDSISKSVIAYQRNYVSALSFASSIPGGFLMIPAVTMDLAQFFYHTVVIVQKLAYLYGFDEFEFNEKNLNATTMNKLLIFIGAMYGVNGTSKIIKTLSLSMQKQIVKNLSKKALTKVAIYPVVKKIAKVIGIKITKQVFSNAVGSTVPIIGGFISGTIAFTSFNANCNALKKVLRSNKIANPNFYKVKEIK